MDEPIIVDFSRPMPVFPLPGVVVLPHAVRPLHIFEPRFRQMVANGLEEAEAHGPGQGGQLAMACLAPRCGESPVCLRPVVCIGRIVEHEPLPDGRSNIRVQGLCRAPASPAFTSPRGSTSTTWWTCPRSNRQRRLPGAPWIPRPPAPPARQRAAFWRMQSVQGLIYWLDQEEVPVHALVELVAHELISDDDQRYAVLAEADPHCRPRIVHRELLSLERLIAATDRQSWHNWPKGLSWN